jgi:putative FmdB family regulatory protein
VPLYEFECQTCHHRFEKIQGFSDADPACVKCGGKVERLMAAPAVQFKGSGWYATDYPKPGSAKSESKAGEKSESKSGDKSDSSSTSKPETKSESKSDTKSESKAGSSKD